MAHMSQAKKALLAPAIKAILKEYDLKGSLKVHGHSTLILTISGGPIDFLAGQTETNIDVNTYYIDRDFSGKAAEVLKKIHAAMSVGNHDRSDHQSDYFDVGWYSYIYIGRWDKPYQLAA